MRNSFLAFIVAGALAATLVPFAPPARAGEVMDTLATPFYFFCRTNYDVDTTFYFSTTQKAAAGVTRQALQAAFREYMKTQYKYPNDQGVSCVFSVIGDLQANTELNRKATIDNLHAAQYKVVEVDWKYVK